MLPTFPSRYLSTIGLEGVFSLAGWSRRVRAGFHVPRATQGTATRRGASRMGLSPAAAGLSSPSRSPPKPRRRGPTTPRARRHASGLGCSPFARHYWGNHCCFLFLRVLRCFSSPGSPRATMARSRPTRAGGCPIRTPAGQWPVAPHRSFSQLPASFLASSSQGIRHAPLFTSTRPTKWGGGAGRLRGAALHTGRLASSRSVAVLCASVSKIVSPKRRTWRISDSNRWPLACHASALAS